MKILQGNTKGFPSTINKINITIAQKPSILANFFFLNKTKKIQRIFWLFNFVFVGQKIKKINKIHFDTTTCTSQGKR